MNLNQTETRNVPAAACRLTIGEFSLGDNGETAKTAPIKMSARSGQPLNHWYFGPIVHDMSGLQLHKDRIPIDYCHDDFEVIGYLNKFETKNGDLVATGALTPFKGDDRATEVIFKSKAGVPYEASIFFDEPLLEEVRDGQTSMVNGYQFAGPGVIVRQWNLRGVAVCPYGMDKHTSSEFSQGGKELPVRFLKQGDMQMSNQNAEVATATVEATESKSVEAAAPAAAVEAAKTELSAEIAPAIVEANDPVTTVEASVAPGHAFMQAFGETDGAIYFAKGMSMADAMTAHMSKLSAENEKLRTQLAQSRAERGMPAPVEFSAVSVAESSQGLIRIAGRSK